MSNPIPNPANQPDLPGESLEQVVERYKLAADRARQAYAHEAAIRFYQLALDTLANSGTDAEPAREFDLLAGRQFCLGMLGQQDERQADLDRLWTLAGRLQDPAYKVQVIIQQVDQQATLGKYALAQQVALTGLRLARQAKDPALEGECLLSVGYPSSFMGDYSFALDCYKKALRIFRKLGAQPGLAQSYMRLGECLKDMGQAGQSKENADKAYGIFRSLGDQFGQAHCLNTLGIITGDQAQARSYYEQALQIFQTVGDRTWQANLYNNLGLVYWRLGLYGKARDLLDQAVGMARGMQIRSSMSSFLESLGRILIGMDDYAGARQALEEGLSLSREIGDRLSETTYLMMLGRVALASGQLAEARDLTWQACEMQRNMGAQGYLVTSLAWLGAVYLEMDDLPSAERFTADAVEQLSAVGKASEFPTQDLWWLRYQALKAELVKIARSFDPELPLDDIDVNEPAWVCLQNAYAAMFADIGTLSDDGLRRNYLNKIKFNRDILTEWTLVAPSRRGPAVESPLQLSLTQESAAPPEPFHIHDRMKRLLDISLQMNATLDPDALLDFVMENVIELSGAERGFLVLVSETGAFTQRVERGMQGSEPSLTGMPASYPLLEKVIETRVPVLQEFSGQMKTGSLSPRRLLVRRSAMCLPLLRRLGLIGVIYVDTSALTGRFSQADLDLLSLFCYQAATALENARFFRERERRITELSILDEIGRSLASTLNLSELLETVYQQVGRIFDVTNFHIATYQEGDTEWVAAFQMDQGVRRPVQRMELVLGLTGHILRNRIPVLINSPQQNQRFKEVNGIPTVGALAKSWMGVPLLAADKIVGAMAIQSYEVEGLYDEHALNLFSTIAAQVAIAIRNTRLYEEKSSANRELESFSYSVSHDLRAPIRAINGFSRILLEDYGANLDAEGKKYLHRVNEAGLRMGMLIDDILNLSRVTRSEIRRGPVDMSRLAYTVLADLYQANPERRVDWVIAPDLRVNADANLMRILLENLLGNAWKFTQKHPIARIELGVTQVDNQTTFFVSDDGAGFDMTYVDKLFGAFQRLHTNDEFEGTGIGLATVQRIVQRHGGTVWAEGAIDQGAKFFFTIPG